VLAHSGRPMSSADTTTLRLTETTSGTSPASLWLVWGGLGAAPPIRLLERDGLLLGRGAEAPGRLDFPGVSRQHAELLRQGPLVVVRDRDSTNGTFLNGRRVESAALSEGDVLRLGDAVAVAITVRDDLSPPSTIEAVKGVLFGPGLSEVLELVRRLAADSLPVVLVGETGVGKEGVARALHELSGRKGPLQAVNCGALPVALAEAELFGHRKGAFTGAEQAGLGHIRAADGGTLFLDELYDLAPPVQTKLLRVLQEKVVVPIGETRPIPVDVRVIAASLMPLSELVAKERLREDLAARLAGVSIVIPPLAERRADIPVLLSHFLREYSGGRPPGVDGRLLEYLLLQPWPGNVRELELLARRLLALRRQEPVLRRSMLGDPPSKTPAPNVTPVRRRSSEEAEPDLKRLRERFAAHGNLSRAAQEAGFSRQRAYRLLRGGSAQDLLDAEGANPENDEHAGPKGQSEALSTRISD
jgi:transcriptional regulator with AAA-type ATPase domain